MAALASNFQLSKSAENSFGAASRVRVGKTEPWTAPKSEEIVALIGMGVCDGAHRLDVMKNSMLFQ